MEATKLDGSYIRHLCALQEHEQLIILSKLFMDYFYTDFWKSFALLSFHSPIL